MGEFRVVTRSSGLKLSSLKKKFFREEGFFDGENDVRTKGRNLP
jgi:hypothetical protein